MRSIEIDIRFDGGRVRVKQATGLTDRRTVNDVRAMLRLLWRQPQHRGIIVDLARPLTDPKRRNLFDVYAAYLSGRLADLSPSFDDQELRGRFDAWFAQFQASESHRRRVEQCFDNLLEQVRHKPRLSELPDLLEAYRMRCVKAGTPRAFNYAKQSSLALLRDTVGRRHPLWLGTADIASMPESKQGVPPLTVAEAHAVTKRLLALPVSHKGQRSGPYPSGTALHVEAAEIWEGMCWTGMGQTEMWGEWTTLPDRVRINGTKRPGRRWGTTGREVPLICAMRKPTMTVGRFEKLLKRAGASPYQARHSYAIWLEEAEVMRTVRRMLLGHGAKDVTDRYERREISQLLAGVREKMLKYRASQMPPEQTLHLTRTAGIVAGPIALEA